jgi:hypothetical protein
MPDDGATLNIPSRVRGFVTNNIGFLDWMMDLLTLFCTISLTENQLQRTYDQSSAEDSLHSHFTTDYSLCFTLLYAVVFPFSHFSTTILLQLLNSQFQFSNPLAKVTVTLRSAVSRPVGQSVLVSSTHLKLKTRFLFLSDSCANLLAKSRSKLLND